MRPIAILLALLACAAQPAAAASSPGLSGLERHLGALVASSSADVGIAAVDLANGEAVSVNGDRLFPMASTMKVAVAAAFLQQVDNGRRTLDDRIGGQSARQLIERMLVNSDNPATDRLIRNLGGPDAIHEWVRWHGLKDLRVDRTIAELLRARRDLWDLRDSASPTAMVELLRRIDGGKVLKPGSRAYLLATMERCKTGKNRMRALLPAGTRVEHKTGTLAGYSSDVGFITLPDGRRLAVALFARGGSDRPRTIAVAARAIYDGFTSLFRSPFATGAN